LCTFGEARDPHLAGRTGPNDLLGGGRQERAQPVGGLRGARRDCGSADGSCRSSLGADVISRVEQKESESGNRSRMGKSTVGHYNGTG